MLDAGCRILDAGYWILDDGCRKILVLICQYANMLMC
jgi:hypothetical protein